MTFLSIDGIDWQIPCSIERVSKVTESDVSGMLLDKTHFSDVIGTYLQYDVKIAVPFGMEGIYATIYEQLTNPVGSHTFVLPYSNGFITVNGRITNVKDTFVRLPGNKHYWRGTAFSIISNNPVKKMELDEVITMGIPPLPPETDVSVGEVYEYSSSGWVELANAEDNYY